MTFSSGDLVDTTWRKRGSSRIFVIDSIEELGGIKYAHVRNVSGNSPGRQTTIRVERLLVAYQRCSG